MSIQQRYQPNLETQDVFKYVSNVGNTNRFDEALPARNGFGLGLVQKKLVGKFSALPSGEPIRKYWTIEEYYQVVEGKNPGQIVGNFNVIVPAEQKLNVEIYSVIYIKNGIDPAIYAKIEGAFNSYLYPRDGDPIDYMQAKLAADPTINRGMFDVVNTFSLTKNGNAKEHEEQKRAILSIYNDMAQGSISPGPGLPDERLNENGYFRKREIRARLVSRSIMDGVQNRQKDPVHEVEDPTKTPEEIIGDIVRREGDSLDCGRDFDRHDWKVVTLLEYPEFKIDWRNFEFEIGCGVWIVVSLPVLQIRTSQLNLWAYTRQPKNLGNLIEKIIESCLIRAALSGAVVGVVMGNFVAALAAFKAVFTECIKEKVGQFIQCLIPGLALITEVKAGEDWHDA